LQLASAAPLFSGKLLPLMFVLSPCCRWITGRCTGGLYEPKFVTATCFYFCTPWSFMDKDFVLQILIMLLLCDLLQEKMLEEEHKLLVLRMVNFQHYLAGLDH
jgi:hypothetical protein